MIPRRPKSVDGTKTSSISTFSAHRRGLVGVLFAGVALVATGCQSTQDRSAEIAASLGPIRQEKGLRIARESGDVRVLATTLITDPNGSVVVVQLRNESARDLANVPILIDVFDARGRSAYRNDIPGIEPALASMPFIAAGEEATWVHDQILAVGVPDSVRVKVGAGADPYAGEIPEVSVTEPRLEGDPNSGLAVSGEVVNRDGSDQERVLLYAVARDGDRIVAAGRGAVEHLKATGKPLPYNVFFIGDPRGARVDLAHYPTLPGEAGQ
jgi:hypothetical protein